MTSAYRATAPDRYRALCAAAIALLFVFTAIFSPTAQADSNPKYASIVIDSQTGRVLHERHADKALHPASLVKVMTLLMVFDALENGTLRLRDPVPISAHAASMVPSKLGLPAGSTIRVEDAIYALVTKSANDVAAALGEKIGGTESQFAAMMTRRAQAIGLKNTRFSNASGLHNPRQVSTARDMALLARFILQRYPQHYHYFSTRQFSYNGTAHRNHNRLMETYAGMDGFKTGFIQASGFNLVASARRGNQRVIGVVFGGRTTASRNSHMATLLDRGFARMNGGNIPVAAATATAPARRIAAAAPLPNRKPAIAAQIAALNNLDTAAGAAMAIPRDALPSAADSAAAAAALRAPHPPVPPARADTAESGDNDEALRLAQMNEMLQGSLFQDMIGEGDFDPAVTKRLETGLIAISALRESRGEKRASTPAAYTPPARTADTPAAGDRDWSVQIGAYSSRVKTDRALQKALNDLPRDLASSSPIIVPLKTQSGWVFRGRLSGYSKAEAEQACHHLKDCLPVSPQAY